MKAALRNVEALSVDNFSMHLKFVQLMCNTHHNVTSLVPFELVFHKNVPDLWSWNWGIAPSTEWPVSELHDLMKGTRQNLQEVTRDSAHSTARTEFKVNDEVIRFIRLPKFGGMKSVPHPRAILRLVERESRGQWIATDSAGNIFRVPEYQLKKVDSAADLRRDLPGQDDIEPILVQPLKVGELLVVEDTTQDGTEWTYGLFRLTDVSEISEGKILCSKLWWDHPKSGSKEMVWKEYPDEAPVVISLDRVIANRVILRHGRIPRKLLDRLEFEQNPEIAAQ
jgi:hypothetical protein